MKRIQPNYIAWGLMGMFTLIFASISLVNHYLFRTFAFDLGIKNQALWDYAHFRYNYNTIMPELAGEINILANHFEPILFLFGPLYYLFGSYTLLVVQLVFVVAAGWPIYKYVTAIGKHAYLGCAAMFCFYSFWGIYSALSYDFHTNVLGAMLVPWIWWFAYKRNWIAASVAVLLMVHCKENMALWGFFLGTGMALHFWKSAPQRWFGIGWGLFSLTYFVVIMNVWMPYFADGKMAYLHFQYSAIGSSPVEILETLVTKPGYVFRLLFENHLSSHTILNEESKLDLHIAVMLSGGVFLLLRPQFLWMLLPVYGQKLFSDDPAKWGVFVHYSVEFAPILVLCAFSFLASRKNPTIQIAGAFILILSFLDVTKTTFDAWNPLPYPKVMQKFYSPGHYSREFPVGPVKKALAAIPADASVCANSFTVPYVANRKEIHIFPDLKQSDYLVLGIDGINYFPMDSASFYRKLNEIKADSVWQVETEIPGLIILKNKY